jgi:hypothetical protein
MVEKKKNVKNTLHLMAKNIKSQECLLKAILLDAAVLHAANSIYKVAGKINRLFLAGFFISSYF